MKLLKRLIVKLVRIVKSIEWCIGKVGIQLFTKPNTWEREWAYYKLNARCSMAYLFTFRNEFSYKLKAAKNTRGVSRLIAKIDYWLCWRLFGTEPEDYFSFEFFRKDWVWRSHHVTRLRMNFLKKKFNDESLMYLLDSKEKFNEIWSLYLKRNWCVPKKVSYDVFEEKFSKSKKLIVKPLEGRGGKGIYTIDFNNCSLKEAYDRLQKSEGTEIVEEYIEQKGFLNEVNPDSLNTIRVSTVRMNDETKVVFAYFRAGCGNSIVDNLHSGGIRFPIENGKFCKGQNYQLSGVTAHPLSGILVTGENVPDWEKIVQYVCDAHKLAPYGLHWIGWDVCWSNGSLCIIEGNAGPGFPPIMTRKENKWREMKAFLSLLMQ